MAPEDFAARVGPADGQGVVPAPSDEWQRLEQAYREIQRRDGQAEYRAWRWERFALVLVGLWVVTLAVLVWQFLDARRVQAFVQVVQMDDKGTLLQVGLPQDLL